MLQQLLSVLSIVIFLGAIGYSVYTQQVNAPAVVEQQSALDLRRSVFKIRVTSETSDFKHPWKKTPAGKSSGSGFYIGEGRIMTNAHVVANGTYITVQRDGDAKPLPATVEHVAHDCDLALLKVNPDDLGKVTTMTFGGLPKLRSPVATIGYPKGGEQISITAGIVSRVGYRTYVHAGDRQHLLVQVDSAINGGNSGGPVVQKDRVVGVAFQAFTNAENTGYIIPTPVVNRFLDDVKDGHYDGHPQDGLWVNEWTTNNPSLVTFNQLNQDEQGIQVTHVSPWSPLQKDIMPGDILLSIDGNLIGSDGKVDFKGERVDFRTLFDLKQIGDQVAFTLMRQGDRKSFQAKIDPIKKHYESSNVYTFRPKYFVYGGIVFTTLSRSYLRSWGSRWYRQAPFLLRYADAYTDFMEDLADEEEIVIISDRLPHPLNAYAEHVYHEIVASVNGQKVNGIEHLARLLEGGTDPMVVVDFVGNMRPLVLERPLVTKHNTSINQQYQVIPDRWFAEVDGTAKGEWHDKKGH